LRLNSEINQKLKSLGISHKKSTILIVLFSAIGLSFASLSILQHKLNKIAQLENGEAK
jgi:hypothetical protein